MWRPDDWQNPYGKDGELVWGNSVDTYEAGADAMLKDLLKLASESPTKTFTIDSREYNAFKCENCAHYTVSNTWHIVNGKPYKSCNSGEHPDYCKERK